MTTVPTPVFKGSSPPQDQVAPLLPSTAPTPEPRRQINFLKALLLHWVMPKRYGPHLAAGPFTRAIIAHLIAITCLVAALIYGLIGTSQRMPYHVRGDQTEASSFIVQTRSTLARWIIQSAAQSSSSRGPSEATITLLSLPAEEVGLLLLAILAMPWIAGGDRAGSVFKRSYKNVLWATTILIPFSIPLGYLLNTMSREQNWIMHVPDTVIIPACFLVFGLPAVLFLRAALVGAHRYIGDPDGPAFNPREPRCDDCGYRIVGLPLNARCPECGTFVAESLPGGRRKTSGWQNNWLRPTTVGKLLQTQWRVLKSVHFFRQLPVQDGLSGARHFWWATFLLMLLVALAVLRILYSLIAEDLSTAFLLLAGAIYAIPLLFLAQTFVMFAACLWAQYRLHIRDYRISAVVCYYATPLLWPVLVLFLGIWTTCCSESVRSFLETQTLHIGNETFRGSTLGGITLLIAVGAALWFWIHRLTQALRAVRYANV